MLSAHISNISNGFTQSIQHAATGLNLQVVGDGKVEPEIADRFAAPALIENVQERRLKAFVSQQAELRTRNLPEDESLAQLQTSLADTLGKGWEVGSFYPQAGGRGVAAFDVHLSEPGSGKQSLYLEHRDRTPSLTLTTTVNQSGWKVQHTIEATQTLQDVRESARVERNDA